MPHATLPHAQPANVAGTFRIRLQDAPGTTAQASEGAYRWRDNRVEVIRSDGTPVVVPPNASGLALALDDAGPTRQGTLTNVTRVGSSRSSVVWRKVSGGGARVTPGVSHTVVLSARLRMSLWAMGAPFCGKLNGADIELDTELLALLRDACVDDLSLVHTIGWDTRGPGERKARPPRWHNGFMPLASGAHREPYLRKLIRALHDMKVQVIVGYPIVKSTPAPGQPLSPKDQEYRARAQDFANWLKHASPGEIEEYAVSINTFFESRGLDVDGIGFDVEIDEVRREHRDNLALLYRKTSEAMAHRNGLVSYANAPFVQDGVGHSAMQAQPFSIAASGLNLLARPMCYDAVNSTPVPLIEKSIACALRPYRDPYNVDDPTPAGGGGLHPSQVQFGIWASKIERLKGGMAAFCSQVLRPNRIGLMLYTMPVDRGHAKAFLTSCRAWNQALNPGEGPNGQDGLPLQVPRGFGNWPAQRQPR